MMICCCSQNARDWFHACLHDYDRLLNVAVVLIYIQIGCSLIGSLGALYNGVLLVNLGIALFALVAIASSSQSLGRTYAVLLFCAILLDISWFILFSRDIWNMSSQGNGVLFVFSIRLTLAMEILGSCVRFFSSLLWIQIYRLGASYVDSVPTVILMTPWDLITLPFSKTVSNAVKIHFWWIVLQKCLRLFEFNHNFCKKFSLVFLLLLVLKLLKFVRHLPEILVVGVGFVELPALSFFFPGCSCSC